MRVFVSIKHVPDVMSERRIENGRLVRGEDDTLNELDENAIEAAVQAVEDHGGEVIAVTMGPEGAEDSAMLALQKGADRAIVVTDDRLAGSDVVGTAQVLTAVARKLAEEEPIDLIITGMASLDGMTSMVPAAIAADLQWPYLSLASEIQIDEDAVEVFRSADGFDDRLRAGLPAVVSVTDQVNEPRFPNFKDMRAARKKPLDVWSLDDLADVVDVSNMAIGKHGAGTMVLSADEEPERSAGQVIQDAGEGGKKLAEYIAEVLK
ncbi:MAG TPA: electron transfer flavoprotein subunit beta/FixA family protein [Actinomyces sp.]|jgi:electron transfer flavoprotein beta subunit|nr:electron transfer flavoprotein subunit beta/FixA family protein [Acidobacteriota bacterium]HHT41507.1 electron transfer flavoprotein subunit beta/FixA family protein [Actinomyces sp.]